MPALTHLRLDRPGDGVAPLTLDNPAQRNAMSDEMTTSWVRAVDELRSRMMRFYRAWLSIRRLEVPTIAAVNGHAIGAGLGVALACDIRYAAAGGQGRPGKASTAVLGR